MAKSVLLYGTCAILLVIINLELLLADTSTLSKRDQEDGNEAFFRAQRTLRQIRYCKRVGLEKNTMFWKQRHQNLTFQKIAMESNEHVIVYTETLLKSAIPWVLEYVTHVWFYIHAKTTYKEGDDSTGECLAVVIHEGDYPSDQHMYALNKSNIIPKLNILDIGSQTPNLWTDENKRDEAEDLITNKLAYFVEFSSNGKLGSPSSHIWKSPSSQDSAFVEIFTYDVYMNVQEINESAERYKNETILKSHKTTFPKSNTFWFRDWFLPIYENHNGTTVLNNYFNIIAENLPGFYYESDNKNKMTMGEFVHFWSGAAGVDLESFASEAFGWTREFQTELIEARKRFRLKEPFIYEVNVQETKSGSGNELGANDHNDHQEDEKSSAYIWGSSGAAFILVLIVISLYVSSKKWAINFPWYHRYRRASVISDSDL